jgi:hypothetical protein
MVRRFPRGKPVLKSAAAHLPAVHGGRNRDAMGPAQGLEPHATAIVQVAGDHANRLARDAGHLSRPDRVGEMADEKDRDPMIGPPRRQDGLGEITDGGHFGTPLWVRGDG